MASTSQEDRDAESQAELQEMGAWINSPPSFFWADIYTAGVWLLSGLLAFAVKSMGPKMLLLAAAWHFVSIYLMTNNLTFEDMMTYLANRLRGGVYASPPDVNRWKVDEVDEKPSMAGRVVSFLGFGGRQ